MAQPFELQALDRKASQRAGDTEVREGQVHDDDQLELARAGKKQVLTRRFALLSMGGFTASVMSTWEGVVVVFLLGLQNGGPAGLIYGFLFIWIGTFSVFTTMGELASMIPTSAGQYHYVAVLAPNSSKRFLSYISGWATVVGWVAAMASPAFFASSILQAVVILNFPDYIPQRWQVTLIFWGVLLFCVLVVAYLNKILPALEVLVLIVHVLGFFGIIIPLIHLGPHGDAKEIFTTFVNSGGWQTQGLSFFIGLNGNLAAFVGADSAIHMSEEVKGASTTVPQSMLLSIFLNGLLGLGILLAILFRAGDIEAAAASPTGFPFIAIFENAVGSRGGTNAMVCILVVMSIFASISPLAAASRMMWSFARDRGLPWSGLLSKISARTDTPVFTICGVTILSALIGVINIGSSTAFNDVISLVVEAFSMSYLLPSCLLLYRRLRGEIHDNDDETEISQQDEKLHWGKWRVKGGLGVANNFFTCGYLVLICFFAFWPATRSVNAVNMNYSVLVLGAVVVASFLHYLLWARKTYQGPIVEVSVYAL